MVKAKKEKSKSRKKESPLKVKKVTPKAARPKAAKKGVTSPRPKAIKLAKPKRRPPKVTPVPGIIIPEKPKEVLTVPVAETRTEAKIAPQIIRPEVKKPPKQAPEVKKEAPPVKAPPEKVPPPEIAPAVALKELELNFPITVKDLAVKMQAKPSALIKVLMDMRIMSGINEALDEKVAVTLCEKLGFKIKKAPDEEELILGIHKQADRPEDLRPRPPIVTLMGHVDHGKTSLLDAIRKTKVVDSEHGGITQHIGAYKVILSHGEITFLDTPGHEAFSAMRARGASITDIVVLVVAADDGVMPQTQEAIDHARAAQVSIITAINKVDKPQANIDRVKKQLAELGLTTEDWGGKTITVPVSAKSGEGIDDLLEMILLESQMLELKANPKRLAKGIVIETKMSKGRGPVSTLLIQSGTLHIEDNIIVGQYYGKIRAMFDDHGRRVTTAGPSLPVEVLGISGIPPAGEPFFAIADEKSAKELAERRQERQKQQQLKAVSRISLEDLYAQIKEGKLKELKLIIKADVQGSLGAIRETLNKLNVSEIKLDIIHEGVGSINTSDAVLAMASNALILGFNVIMDERAKEIVEKEGIDVRTYNIIYELANDIKAALEGMLEPKLKKIFLGRVEVRKVFKLSRSGTIAGSFVTKGKITRSCSVTLLRNGQAVFEGSISSLKRFKEDVREALEGFECGIALSGFQDFKEGDIIEAFEIEKIARKL